MQNKIYDVIIVGGGPSGISAGIYAKSRGLDTLIIEKNKLGGLIGKISMVTHYVGVEKEESGLSFAKKLEDQTFKAGIEVVYDQILSSSLKDEIKELKGKNNTYKGKVVILATGTSPKKLNLDNENNFINKGLYQNAQNDHEHYKNKTVFVVGGSDGACKEALYLSNFAKKVYIIHHGEKLGAIKEFTSQIEKKENMEVLTNSYIKEVSGVDYVDRLLVEEDGQIKEYKGEEFGVFVHIGGEPNVQISTDLELEDGYIKTNESCKTSIKGVFAVGDVRVKAIRQVSTAVADGTVAGINAYNYIHNL